MTDHPRRRTNIRLPGYDYASPGNYFITIVQKDWMELFGTVRESGEVALNEAGMMVSDVWHTNAARFPWVTVDEFVVMPNHIHGILTFGENPDIDQQVELGTVIQRFKSYTTTACGRGVRLRDWQPFCGKLWLQNYYERVIRNDQELDRFQEYIRSNPMRWLEKRQSR